MRFYKKLDNGYILYIGTGEGGTEITENEYNAISGVIHTKPQATATTDYRLREDMTWEEYAVEPRPEPEPTTDELFEIILGGTP